MLGLHAHTQSMGPLMSSESQLRDKLRKIEALFAGAGTSGERLAAEAALERVRARLTELRQQDPPAELQISLSDQWSRRLFLALCRRYGLEPYRYHRQRRTTLMVRAPRRFFDQVLWPDSPNSIAPCKPTCMKSRCVLSAKMSTPMPVRRRRFRKRSQVTSRFQRAAAWRPGIQSDRLRGDER